MAMSYGELGYISQLPDGELSIMYGELDDKNTVRDAKMSDEDVEDYRDAILSEMESRGMLHP